MKTLLIDAYDSFVYIIYQYLMQLNVDVVVKRHDKISLHDVAMLAPDFIVLGPGPGHPKDAGYVEMIQKFAGTIPILGVCLGHQAIGLAFGGKIEQAKNIMHGKISEVVHDNQGCFYQQKNPFRATRYHSLIVSKDHVPDCLEVTAYDTDDNYIMGLRHKQYALESIQFHPESICTENGIQLFSNFIKQYVETSR